MTTHRTTKSAETAEKQEKKEPRIKKTSSDLKRITQSLYEAGVVPNTIRNMAKQGRLRLYTSGGMTFFSLSEFEAAIRSSSR